MSVNPDQNVLDLGQLVCFDFWKSGLHNVTEEINMWRL